MNRKQNKLYAQLLELSALGEDEIRARVLWCETYHADAWLMKETSKVLGIKARLWAQIPATFPTEWAKELDRWELLSLTQLILIPKKQRAEMAVLAHDWREYTWDYKRVKAEVDKLLEKPKRAKKPKPSCLTDQQCDKIILALNEASAEVDKYDFGLPTHDKDWMAYARKEIRKCLEVNYDA